MIADGPAADIAATISSWARTDPWSDGKWPDRDHAPGNEIVRLWSARVRNEDGVSYESYDIRRPIGLEVEFEILRPGYDLVPNFGIYNEEGLLLFITHDSDPAWRRRPRECGRYVSTAWIPGNLLSEGFVAVDVAVEQACAGGGPGVLPGRVRLPGDRQPRGRLRPR